MSAIALDSPALQVRRSAPTTGSCEARDFAETWLGDRVACAEAPPAYTRSGPRSPRVANDAPRPLGGACVNLRVAVLGQVLGALLRRAPGPKSEAPIAGPGRSATASRGAGQS